MILLLLVALGIGIWAWRGQRGQQLRWADVAAGVAVLIGLRLFTRGEVLPALAAMGGAGFWYWLRRRDGGGVAAMSRDQARRLLDVPDDASAETIRAAHRRLVARVHPDAGGSADLAAQVNAARDTLLAKR